MQALPNAKSPEGTGTPKTTNTEIIAGTETEGLNEPMSGLLHRVLFTTAILFAAAQLIAATPPGIGPQDWPSWRGPTHNGIAAPNQTPPVEWSEKKNLVWKVPLPGRGHASPTVVGEHIYLPYADEQAEQQFVLCLDRATGSTVWQTLIHEGNFDRDGHQRKSHASPTIACDGERLVASFVNNGAARTTALDLDGKILWQRKITKFITHQGYGASPFLYDDLVIIAADNKGGGVVTALDRETGRTIWRRPRPPEPSYVSPVVFSVGGRNQLFLSGCDHVTSLDPDTGDTLWEIPGSTTECVVTMVTDGKRVFTSGGYPKNHTVAVEADGSGSIAWKNSTRVYVPSMIVRDTEVYAVADAGFAICWDSATGREHWKERLGGDFFSTPVYAGGHFYATNIRGTTYVYRGNRDEFELVAKNTLGNEVYSSPVICGSRIYLRVAHVDDQRQEFLYCIGTPAAATR